MCVAHADDARRGGDSLGKRPQELVNCVLEDLERFADTEDLDGVLDVHRGGTQMELAAADFGLRSEDANLGHQIVPDLALDRESAVDVDFLCMGSQIGELGFVYQAAARL